VVERKNRTIMEAVKAMIHDEDPKASKVRDTDVVHDVVIEYHDSE
jgi:hypothetical protein